LGFFMPEPPHKQSLFSLVLLQATGGRGKSLLLIPVILLRHI